MKLFGWMHSKLNASKQVNRKPTNTASSSHHVRQESREEFSDWPHGLLAIGTFGNPEVNRSEQQEIQNIQEVHHHHHQEEEDDPSNSSDDLQDFTPEEIGKLQKELTKLLTKKPSSEKEKEVAKNLPLDRFLNCPSSLEVDRRISNTVTSDIDDNNNNNNEEDIERTISVILGRCKDICEKNKKKTIGKKSISFLLKKMFVCRSGFAPQPSLRDTFQESRMEKLLRTLLHRKINTQKSSRPSSMKNYLEDNKQIINKEKENKDEAHDRCKWVKTDSEYIVLEI